VFIRQFENRMHLICYPNSVPNEFIFKRKGALSDVIIT